ncbi:hypothetical protein [Pseudooceanicola sp.]|uniref:hypothetical protein n=1 Tax=Pseudooceanicola sp. TaxID=1914328 RepID=UPI00263244BE|nr:hypothetical protein [Pseudooceanicola sp.]MDF1856120.1 hypothetical protein [Pseudooceanicola sp.]
MTSSARHRPPEPELKQTVEPADLPRGLFWGMLTGLTSFNSHSDTPLFQTYVLSQKPPEQTFAATTTLTFAAINRAERVHVRQLQIALLLPSLRLIWHEIARLSQASAWPCLRCG